MQQSTDKVQLSRLLNDMNISNNNYFSLIVSYLMIMNKKLFVPVTFNKNEIIRTAGLAPTTSTGEVYDFIREFNNFIKNPITFNTPGDVKKIKLFRKTNIEYEKGKKLEFTASLAKEAAILCIPSYRIFDYFDVSIRDDGTLIPNKNWKLRGKNKFLI